MSLLEKRAALVTEHQAQEKYDPHWQAEAAKGRSLSERPIGFVCDDEIVAVGPCVAKIYGGLQKFVAEHAAAIDATVPQQAHALAKVRSVLAVPPAAELRVPGQTWNAILFALDRVNVLVVLTDGQ